MDSLHKHNSITIRVMHVLGSTERVGVGVIVRAWCLSIPTTMNTLLWLFWTDTLMASIYHMVLWTLPSSLLVHALQQNFRK